MLNHIDIMGRLTRDPELRSTGSGVAVASFTIACERDFAQDGQKETDFIDCVAWRKTGEFAAKYFRKGMLVAVSGRLQIRSWTDKDGNRRKSAEVIADNVYFAEKKNTDAASSGYPGVYVSAEEPGQGMNTGFTPPPYPGNAYTPDFAVVDGDDDQLPF